MKNNIINTTESSNLVCKYCGKNLKNENAHSGHMRLCNVLLERKKYFLEQNSNLFLNDQEYLKKWNSIDHLYLRVFQYKNRYSIEAINFIKEEVNSINLFSYERISEHCVFYLVIIAQIAYKKEIRKLALFHLEELISTNELKILKKYWSNLGNRRYDPSSENYSKIWEKFYRIKDDCFFNIDFPLWLLFFDRYILTYKLFGWKQNMVCGEGIYFIDSILQTYIRLIFLEQDYAGVPNSDCYQTKLPEEVIKFLHNNSKKRFSRTDCYWVNLSKMDYDPRNSDVGVII